MWATKPGDDAPWSRSRRWKLIRCTFQGDAYWDGNGPAQYHYNSTSHDWSGEWSLCYSLIPLIGADLPWFLISCQQPWRGGVSWWMMLQRQPVRVPSQRVLPMTPWMRPVPSRGLLRLSRCSVYAEWRISNHITYSNYLTQTRFFLVLFLFLLVPPLPRPIILFFLFRFKISRSSLALCRTII